MKNIRGIFLFGLVACLIGQSIFADARTNRGERECNCPPQVVTTYCTTCNKHQPDNSPGWRHGSYRFFLKIVTSDGQTNSAPRGFYYYCEDNNGLCSEGAFYKSEAVALNACNQALAKEPRCH